MTEMGAVLLRHRESDLWARPPPIMKIGVKDPLCWGDDCFFPQNDNDAQTLSPSTIARLGACVSASLAEKACALANILNIDLPDAEPGEPEGSESPIPCGIPVAAIPPESFVQKFAGVYIIELLEILTDQRTVGFLFRKKERIRRTEERTSDTGKLRRPRKFRGRFLYPCIGTDFLCF